MKNNKGFTLIEIILVIAIISSIVLITLVSIKKKEEKSKEENYLEMLEHLKNVSSTYLETNDKEYVNKSTVGTVYKLNISTLIEEGLIEEGIINSKTEKVIDDGLVKIEVKENGYLDIEYLEKDFYVEKPNLFGNILTPVIYNGNDWVIPDKYQEWYDYEKQEWANAVVLRDGVSNKPGTVINVEGESPDALAMFVWIPRFEYKIEGRYGTHSDGTEGTIDKPGEIKVNFISKGKNQASDGYILHPAFWWDDNNDVANSANEQIEGFWFAKFETSHKILTNETNGLGCFDENCDNSKELLVLPNIRSLTNNNISNYFYAARSMSRNGNVFGFNNVVMNSHMTKNREWGAAAYLSQSKYGKYGNEDYEGINKEVYFQKNDYTGCSIGAPHTSNLDFNADTCAYNDLKNRGNGIGSCGGGASTTGNIYGIYDMSGGFHEVVMGFNNYLGKGITYNAKQSGFEVEIEKKYYDEYNNYYDNDSKEIKINFTDLDEMLGSRFAKKDSVGHAIGETAEWYNDLADAFINIKNSDTDYRIWIDKSGNTLYVNKLAGIFYSGAWYGDENPGNLTSFRISLTPNIK